MASTSGGTRTHTDCVLSTMPLPIGLRWRKEGGVRKDHFRINFAQVLYRKKNGKTLKQQHRKGGLRYWF